ncbi:hypothetical protein PR003_g21273 [Phytophthora rubi]|uniref:Uncharacterized protein n=1 Tax=Phytophthora rubi TaxID=129364 RepID=A0A6A4DJ34_9STRA|nr:hypothetical protein PR003_g21273 [Phytophthora rubi]
MGVALAALHWGPMWASTGRDRTHVRMWIDNTSAVAWLEKRASQQPIARAYNRLISLTEFQYSFTCSAKYIPGGGKIQWLTPGPGLGVQITPYTRRGLTLIDSWTQVPILPPYDNLLSLWETFSVGMLSQDQLPESTQHTGNNGVSSQINSAGPLGSYNPDDQPTRN